MQQPGSNRLEMGTNSLAQQIVMLEHLCKIRHALPLARCPLPLEICRALAIHPSLTIKGIADELDLEHSQISKCLNKLTAHGIVEEQHSGRCTRCRLSGRCTFSHNEGSLYLAFSTPEGHQITIEGPDTQSQAPEWFGNVSQTAGDLLFPLNRCRIVMCILSQPGLCVSEIAQRCGLSIALTSHHLKKLRKADLVRFNDQQQRHLFRLSTKCRPSGTPDSLHMLIQCERDSHLSLSFRLDSGPTCSILPTHLTIPAKAHPNGASHTKAPEIQTKPQAGKFARDR